VSKTRNRTLKEKNTDREGDAPDGFMGAGIGKCVCSLTDEDATTLGAIGTNVTEAAALVAALVLEHAFGLGDFPPRETAPCVADGGTAVFVAFERNVEFVAFAVFKHGVKFLIEGIGVDEGSK
jgi:hypothetical protein